jgi:membrane protein YqaA with SNARE-associated domain
MLHELYEWMLHWAATPHAEIALCALAFAESSFFPLPPDILLIAMGVANPAGALWYALLCSVGSVSGGAAGYGMGRWAGRPLIVRVLSESRRKAVENLYNRFDYWAIGIAGFTPIPYKVFTLTAGMFDIPFKNFFIASTLSRPARFFLVGGALYFWGAAIQGWLEKYFNIISIAFVVLLVGGFFLLRWLEPMLIKKQTENDPSC